MKISLEWLREYATLDAPLDKLVGFLVDTGTEVDRVHRGGAGMVVAKIKALTPVPESTKGMWFADVDAGEDEPVRVLTGAQNLHVGDLVPWAKPGSRLPNGMELGVRPMFGGKYQSPGMLCSAVELGLGEEADGILLLEDGRPGQALYEVLPLDVVLDVEVTPNRPDCMCHLGLARELAAAMGEGLREPAYEVPEALLSAASGAERVNVKIEDPDGCPRFAVRIIEGVAVGDSPDWLKRRLLSIGLRPINNVVDVTNYVAHELGQPLHAFDMDKFTDVAGAGRPVPMVIRRARAGEKLLCLDDVERAMTEDDLVVCAGETPASMAGVIGGQPTAVAEGTRNVLLESANWEPGVIRATSRRHAVRTDASTLFEKGLSDVLTMQALERAAALIAEIAHGHVLRDPVDEWPRKLPQTEVVEVSADTLSGILGYSIDASEAAGALAHLGFRVEQDGEKLVIGIPHFRRDVAEVVDIAEEVGRALGYHRVPATLPGRRVAVTGLANEASGEERVRDIALGAGYDEVLPYVFYRPQMSTWLPGLGEQLKPIALMNPVSDEWSHLRTGLLPGLAQTVAFNQNRGVHDARVFELGRVFWEGERRGRVYGATPDNIDDDFIALPAEPLLLGVMAQAPDGSAESAAQILREQQSLLDFVVHDISGENVTIEPAEVAGLRPGRAGTVMADGRKIGVIGELDELTAEKFELRGRVVAAELRLDAVEPMPPGAFHYRPVPKFPAVVQDLAVTVNAENHAGPVLGAIHEVGGPFLESAVLYDEFRNAKLGPAQKGWTFRLTFRSAEKTLTSEEAQHWQDAITLMLKQRFGATLRS